MAWGAVERHTIFVLAGTERTVPRNAQAKERTTDTYDRSKSAVKDTAEEAQRAAWDAVERTEAAAAAATERAKSATGQVRKLTSGCSHQAAVCLGKRTLGCCALANEL